MHNPDELDKTTRSALELIGGEPLFGSGFEAETPEAEFADEAPAEERGR